MINLVSSALGLGPTLMHRTVMISNSAWIRFHVLFQLDESSPEVSVTSFEERQEILKTLYGFECHCHFCQKEKRNSWQNGIPYLVKTAKSQNLPLLQKHQQKIVHNYNTKDEAGVCCGPCNPSKWEADIWGWLEVRRSAILHYFTTQWTRVPTELADSMVTLGEPRVGNFACRIHPAAQSAIG